VTQALHQLTASMVNQLNRVDTISNNLANANTTGFKQDFLAEGTYRNHPEKPEDKINKHSDVGYKLEQIMNKIPKIDNGYTDSSVGALKLTGNDLDFALTQKDTYFKIQKENGDILYTRDGAFKIANDTLITQNGNKVLDANGNEIKVKDNIKNISSLLAIYEANFNTNDKVGSNNFKASNPDNVKQITNENNNKVISGSLESSNVNSMISMVNLIEAQRKFEQSQKAITGIDEINKKVIDSIGNGG